MPSGKYGIKCPYSMTPKGITFHNTANDASAMAEVSYMIGNKEQVSFHEAIDDYRVVQGIEHNRNAWASGDGANGFGNRNTIHIEICYSKSGGSRFDAAERLAAQRGAQLMKMYGWTEADIGTKIINTHKYRSGKNCPHRTLSLGIDRFYNMLREEYRKLMGATSTPTKTPTTGNYYPKYTGGSAGLDSILKAIGVPSNYYGSWSKRKPLAKANGISNYSGTADQNTKLITLAKQGKLVKVGATGATSTPTKTPTTSKYYSKYTGGSAGLDSILKAIGVPSNYYGSWTKRKPLAKANGISNYTGTAIQNTKLITLAKQGKLIKV